MGAACGQFFLSSVRGIDSQQIGNGFVKLDAAALPGGLERKAMRRVFAFHGDALGGQGSSAVGGVRWVLGHVVA